MDLTPRTKKIIAVVAGLALIYFLWAIHHVLLPFLVAFLLVYLLNPLVDWLSGARASGVRLGRFEFNISLGRKGAVAIVFVAFFGLVALGGLFVVPQLYAEGARIARELPQTIHTFEAETLPIYVDKAQALFDAYGLPVDAERILKDSLGSFAHIGEGQTSGLVKQAQGMLKGVFDTIISVVLVFMLTLFLLLDWPHIKKRILNMVPERHRDTVLAIGRDIDRGLNGAIRGQLLVCLINGVLTTAGLLLLQVKYAVTIGLIAAVFSMIPIFGTVISTVPAVLIALTQSWIVALQVVGMICLIHLIEANFLNPKVLGHNAEIHPVLVIFALLIGEHYGGAIGLIFAVPVAAIVRALLTFGYRLVRGQLPVSAHAEDRDVRVLS
jgi:predicted PurR-regulated permease PerM